MGSKPLVLGLLTREGKVTTSVRCNLNKTGTPPSESKRHNKRSVSGYEIRGQRYFCRIRRLDMPFRLFTSEEMDIFGG